MNKAKISLLTVLMMLCALNQKAQIPKVIIKEITEFSLNDNTLEYLEFISENINNHYSRNYYWLDSCQLKVDFNELEYSDFSSSVDAFNAIKKSKGELIPITFDLGDAEIITKEILNSSIKQSQNFTSLNPDNQRIIKDYLLPYRITDEPLTDWRNVYNERFKVFQDAENEKENTVSNIIEDINTWFICTYGIEKRQDPINHLSALQLLHRKKGGCEDVANLMVFALRSIGIPSSVDVIPLWGTTQGGHVLNSYFDDDCNAVHFDALSYDSPLPFKLEREPAKVLRLTYSEKKETLASNLTKSEIPNVGLLRSKNYIDVTNEYWPTANISFELNKDYNGEYVYASVFNGMSWKPVWYSKVKDNVATFQNMTKGVVYISQSFQNKKPVTISNPKVFISDKIITLEPEEETHNISITEMPGYLKFRTGKGYTLYYFDKKWIKHSRKIHKDSTSRLIYKNVPKNSLLILRPEYSKGKERPFSIQDDGTRLWW